MGNPYSVSKTKRGVWTLNFLLRDTRKILRVQGVISKALVTRKTLENHVESFYIQRSLLCDTKEHSK